MLLMHVMQAVPVLLLLLLLRLFPSTRTTATRHGVQRRRR